MREWRINQRINHREWPDVVMMMMTALLLLWLLLSFLSFPFLSLPSLHSGREDKVSVIIQ